MSLKIRVNQLSIKQGCIDRNYEKVKEIVKESAHDDVELVVFPQYTMTGYPTAETLKELEKSCTDINERMKTLAKENAIGLIYSQIEVDGDNFCENVIYINSKGVIEAQYQRINKFWREDKCLLGDKYVMLDINGIKIGLMSGDDIFYPELPRTYALKGAEAVICLYNNVNHRMSSLFDVQSVVESMIPSYTMVNELDFIFCSAEGQIDEDDNQSIVSGAQLVGGSVVYSISEGKIKKLEEGSKTIDVEIQPQKLVFHRRVCKRVESLRMDVLEKWREQG